MLLDLGVGLDVNFDEVVGFADLLCLRGTTEIVVVVRDKSGEFSLIRSGSMSWRYGWFLFPVQLRALISQSWLASSRTRLFLNA